MRNFIVISTFVLLSATATARDEQKLYKWTDAEGNVYYSDTVPAEFSERPKAVLNEQGVAVDELAGKKTDEQLEQERREEEVRVAKEKQQRADQALLATYLSVEEIVMHRDRRVELFQAQSRVTELYLKNLLARLESIRREASRYQPYAEDPNAPMIPDDLARDLRETKDTIARHENNLKKYERDERDIIEQFDRDISRFRILKGIETPQAALLDRRP